MEQLDRQLLDKGYIECNRKLMWAGFYIYIFFLIWITLFKFCDENSLTHKGYIAFAQLPLKDRYNYQFKINLSWDVYKMKDVVFNSILFLPLGIYVPLIVKKYNYFQISIVGIVTTLSIELIELFTACGAFEYLDLIINMIGLYIGMAIYNVIIYPYCNKKVVDIINILVIVTAGPCAIWATIYTIYHYEWYLIYYGIIPKV